eukprot:767096-Hanusia_phi.AAC.8
MFLSSVAHQATVDIVRPEFVSMRDKRAAKSLTAQDERHAVRRVRVEEPEGCEQLWKRSYYEGLPYVGGLEGMRMGERDHLEGELWHPAAM